jgi:hypothetical protein
MKVEKWTVRVTKRIVPLYRSGRFLGAGREREREREKRRETRSFKGKV